MTKRAKINSSGVWLSMAGYDVDTADESKLLFSPYSPQIRIMESGFVSGGGYVKSPGQPSDYSTLGYYTTTVNYALTYPSIPMVFVSGVWPVSGVDRGWRPIRSLAIPVLGSRWLWEPELFIAAHIDKVVIYCRQTNTTIPNFAYYVMDGDA